jgi:2,5-diamino-6-(ribosylamino)-4(3H)-pyrimidinone 5'-phosphate reductase
LTGKILRLYPLPAQEILAGGIYEDLELPPPGRTETPRPYVIINMVSSVDGRTAVEGKSSRLGSETDRQTMRTLRSRADAVMIGAGTLRAERLSLGLDDPSGRQPLAVIVTKTGDVPLESNLIVGEHQEVLVITTQDAPKNLDDRLRESARVLRAPATPSGAINLGEALQVLRARHTVEVLLVEGGPSLNHALISQDLADELFLTLAPKLLGGTSYELLDGPALAPIDAKLLSAHLAGSELFLRYALLKGSKSYNTL